MEEIRFALIGAGGIGALHASRFGDVEGGTLAAVVDVDGERARSVAEKYGIEQVYTSTEEALSSGEFEAVDICVPTGFHAEVSVLAARGGKHVLCEKPMAVTMEGAGEMIAACEEAGVLFTVAQCRRYDNHWKTIRSIVRDGVIGSPVVWRSISASQGPRQDWFYAREMGMGPLLDGAIHNYDFARTMFGEAVWVQASTGNFKDVSAPDTGSAAIGFTGGDELQLSWSWGLPKGVSGFGAEEILGPKGVIKFHDPGNLDLPPCPEGKGRVVAVLEGGRAVPFDFDRNDMYVDEIQAFVEGIRSGRAPEPDGEEARRSLEVGLSVIEAGDTEERIDLGVRSERCSL